MTYRDCSRTIDSESESINLQWPVAEIIVETIKVLDRKRKANADPEEAA